MCWGFNETFNNKIHSCSIHKNSLEEFLATNILFLKPPTFHKNQTKQDNINLIFSERFYIGLFSHCQRKKQNSFWQILVLGELSNKTCIPVLLGGILRIPLLTLDPAGNYMLKVNNKNTRTRYEICSKVNNNDTRTTPLLLLTLSR